MRWLNANLKDSVLALLGGGELSPTVLGDRTEDIRVFILAELGEFAEENTRNWFETSHMRKMPRACGMRAAK